MKVSDDDVLEKARMAVANLIPVRFLCLVAHLTILVTLFWSRKENVIACLALSYEEHEYNLKNKELTIGLSVGLVLLSFEFVGFISGVSMFMPTQALISIAAHFSAALSLTFFLIDGWDCDIYWWIFGFCSALPSVTEFIVVVGVLGLKKSL